ncbi:ribonuclease HII [Rhodococcus sp. HNM0569]|nr:ribonuclease HII [Rhodococcus sp. HNM0569]
MVRRSSGLRTMESTLLRCGLGPVAGVDEAGRGACAGPLVVAACVLPARPLPSLERLDDSKKLTERVREELFPIITRVALGWSVVEFSAAEVDAVGVHRANIEGMRRAVAGLGLSPGYVLTDGFRVPGLPAPSLPVIGGDAAAACIAAASVLAKVSRDRTMVALGEEFPQYDFGVHKGYCTRRHMRAIADHGASTQHRLSWSNVRALVQGARPDEVALDAVPPETVSSDPDVQAGASLEREFGGAR